MRRAGVPQQQCVGLSVAVANGDKISSPGKCPLQRVIIGQEAFDIDLYAPPLGGSDMILGVHWLATLGPMLWVFVNRTLCFVRHGKGVLWTGIDARPRSNCGLSGGLPR